MARPVKHQLLNRPGLWRIVNFRHIVQSPSRLSDEDLRIQVVVGQIAEEEKHQPIQGPLKTVAVPIGDLPLLKRNGLIRDGVILPKRHRPKSEVQRKLSLDFSPENLKFFSRFEKDKLGLILRETSYTSDEDRDTLYLAIGQNGDPYSIIVPSTDIFSFFYATSTYMAQLVLSEKILEPELHIYDPDKTQVRKRSLSIRLRKDVPEESVRFLSMLLFDEYALQETQSIHQYRLSHQAALKPLAVRARPPIKGKASLILSGIYIDNNRFFTTQIHKCFFSSRFENITWEQEGRANTISTGPVKSGTAPRELPDIDSPNTIEDTPGDQRKRPSEVEVPEIENRFPLLQRILVRRAPKAKSKDKPAYSYIKTSTPAETGTTALGGDGPRTQRPTQARGKERPSTESKATTLESINLDPDCISDQCISTARLLITARKHKLAVINFLQLDLDPVPLQTKDGNALLRLLPALYEKKDKAWLYTNLAKSRRRVVTIAKIQFENETRYIFEFQKRLSQSISTAIIWSSDPHQVPNKKDLKKLLFYYADPSLSKRRTGPIVSNYLVFGRLLHPHTATVDWKEPIKFAEAFLARLFEVQPLPDARNWE